MGRRQVTATTKQRSNWRNKMLFQIKGKKKTPTALTKKKTNPKLRVRFDFVPRQQERRTVEESGFVVE